MATPAKPSARSSATQEQFYELFNTATFADVFNEKYIDGLEKRRDFLDGQTKKSEAIQILAFSLLALSVFPIHLPFSFLGLSVSNVRDVREILLVVCAYSLFYIVPLGVEKGYISDLLQAHVRKLSKGNDVALLALKTRYGLQPLKFPEMKMSLRHAYFVLVASVGLLVSFLLLIVFPIVIAIVALFDIVRDPTVSITVSILVIIFFIGAIAANGLLAIESLVARFRGRVPDW
jgi:hypothetical protein